MPDIVPNPKVLAQDVVCEKNLLAKSVKSLALVWHVGKITPILIVPVKVIWTFTCEGVMSPNWQTDLQMQITNVLLIAEVPNCKDNRESHKDGLAQWRGENDQTGINQWHLKDLLEQRSAIRKWRSYHIAVNSRDPFVEGEMSKRLLKSAWHSSYAVLTSQIAHSSVRRLGLLRYFWTVKWTRSLPK